MNTTIDTRFRPIDVQVEARTRYSDAGNEDFYHLFFTCRPAGTTHEVVLDAKTAKELTWLLQSHPQLARPTDDGREAA